jgi:hypothetical protein
MMPLPHSTKISSHVLQVASQSSFCSQPSGKAERSQISCASTAPFPQVVHVQV